MNYSKSTKYYNILQELMAKAGISNLRQLSCQTGVAELQILRLQNGLLPKMQLETLLKIAQGLNISLNQLINLFSDNQELTQVTQGDSDSVYLEFDKLQKRYEQQEVELTQKFQLSSLEILESWLLQWPTAISAVNKNPDFPATRLLPLVKPIQKLLEAWNVETIASVGAKIAYEPIYHELMEGTANHGDLVEVRYVGYRQGDKLLHRAKVIPCIIVDSE